MTVRELLAGLNREQLIDLLERLVDRQPDLMETIGLMQPIHLDQAAEAPTVAVPPPLPQHPPIDLADFRRRVGATFGGAGQRYASCSPPAPTARRCWSTWRQRLERRSAAGRLSRLPAAG